jgi:septal ring factor EnvC (AmiA/AmiB activator)
MNQVEEKAILRKVDELNKDYIKVLTEKKRYANSLIEAYEKEGKLLTRIQKLQAENAKLSKQLLATQETNKKLKNNYKSVFNKLEAIYKYKSYIFIKLERKLLKR